MTVFPNRRRALRALSLLVRGIWVLISLTTFAMLAVSVVTLSTELRKPCELDSPTDVCNSFEEQGLRDVGISRPFYTNLITAGVIVEVLPWLVAGFILFWKRSHDWYSLLLSLSMITLIGALIDQGIMTWAAWRFPETEWIVDGLYLAGQVSGLAWVFFPNVKRMSIGLLLFCLYLLQATLGGFFFPGSPLDNGTWPDFLRMLHWVFIIAVFLGVYINRYRKSSLAVQQQIKWVVWAFILLGITYLAVLISLTYATTGAAVILLRLTLVPLQYLSSGLAAFAILAAMLRYQLFEIDIIIRRTLSYAVLTGALAAVYFGGVVLLQTIFRGLTGQASSPLITVLSTLAIAALFNPLRTRIQEFIDRRFYRRKYDTEQALASFTAAARDDVDLESLSEAILSVVGETMQPADASLWLRPAGRQDN